MRFEDSIAYAYLPDKDIRTLNKVRRHKDSISLWNTLKTKLSSFMVKSNSFSMALKYYELCSTIRCIDTDDVRAIKKDSVYKCKYDTLKQYNMKGYAAIYSSWKKLVFIHLDGDTVAFESIVKDLTEGVPWKPVGCIQLIEKILMYLIDTTDEEDIKSLCTVRDIINGFLYNESVKSFVFVNGNKILCYGLTD